jgi:hypothetical protein
MQVAALGMRPRARGRRKVGYTWKKGPRLAIRLRNGPAGVFWFVAEYARACASVGQSVKVA